MYFAPRACLLVPVSSRLSMSITKKLYVEASPRLT